MKYIVTLFLYTTLSVHGINRVERKQEKHEFSSRNGAIAYGIVGRNFYPDSGGYSPWKIEKVTLDSVQLWDTIFVGGRYYKIDHGAKIKPI